MAAAAIAARLMPLPLIYADSRCRHAVCCQLLLLSCCCHEKRLTADAADDAPPLTLFRHAADAELMPLADAGHYASDARASLALADDAAAYGHFDVSDDDADDDIFAEIMPLDTPLRHLRHLLVFHY